MEDEEKNYYNSTSFVIKHERGASERALSDERNVFKLIYEMCGECVSLNWYSKEKEEEKETAVVMCQKKISSSS